MKKIFFSLSLALSILILASCHGKNKTSSEVGSLTFTLQLKGAAGNNAKVSMAPVDCSASGIATIEASVYDQNGSFLVSGGPWACTLHTGTISGIQAGTNRKIIINTRDASGNILYSGEKTGLTVTANTTNSAGEITMTPFIYWSVNTIDSVDDFGRDSSLALDANKKVHIAYYDVTKKDLKYITNASGSWMAQTIDSTGDVGSYPSIAVDGTGKIHISYYDVTNTDLKYATNASGSWAVTTVESADDVGQYSDIALDASSKVHISYYDNTNQRLMYSTDSSGSWVSTVIDNPAGVNVGKYSAIAIGPTGNIHVSYLDETNVDLKYATNTGGTWFITALDQSGNVGEYSDIGVDSSDKVHISYFDANNEALKYASNASGNWVNTTVDTQAYEYSPGYSPYPITYHYVGYRTAITVDASGKVHISYHERLHDYYSGGYTQNYRWKLKYATNSSGSWITYGVDSISDSVYYPVPPSIGDTAIAVDSGKKVHISYYNMASGDLKYATSSSSSWSTNTIDMAANVGEYTSLAADSSGKAYVAFYDITNGNLKYMTNASGAWTATTIESIGDTGKHASIAVDANKKAHISYYDTTRGTLKYATNSLASWSTATIDSSANVGEFSSIALDTSGKAHISYISETHKDLMYATNSLGSWATTTVDSAGNVGYYTDIAVESTGKIYISYSDESGRLKIATRDGSWTTTVIDTSTTTSGVQYQYTSIRIDASGKEHISYYDVVNGDLKYATNKSGSWVKTTIDSVGDVGKFTSLALDGSGNVHISYYDVTNGDLRYATNQSGAWLVYTLDSGGDVGQYSSLAIDALGNRHISYYNATTSDIKYATTSPTGAGQLSDQTAPAAPTGLTATPVSTSGINLAWNGSNDNIGVAGYKIYRDGNLVSTTTAANFSDTGLSSYTPYCFTISAYDASDNESAASTPVCATTYMFNETAIPNTDNANYFDMAVDSSGKVHISYQKSTLLMHITDAPGSWATTTVDSSSTGGGYYNSIAVDGSGNSYISYTNWSSPNMYLMFAAETAPGSWTTEIRDSLNSGYWFNSKIATDASGHSHIVYTVYDSGSGEYVTKYATDSLGSWNTSTIYTQGGSYPPAIAVDSANNVHIAYAKGSELLHAVTPSGEVSWTTSTVDTATVPNYWFQAPAIAVDSNNKVHISYYDGQWIDNAYHLKYATNAAGSWVTTTVDADASASSIATDPVDNSVHIVYPGPSSTLKYAVFTSGSGTPTIYTIVNASGNSLIKVDQNHRVHILSRDIYTGGLKHLTTP